MNPLQQKLNELLTIVSTEAGKGEETFFKRHRRLAEQLVRSNRPGSRRR